MHPCPAQCRGLSATRNTVTVVGDDKRPAAAPAGGRCKDHSNGARGVRCQGGAARRVLSEITGIRSRESDAGDTQRRISGVAQSKSLGRALNRDGLVPKGKT